jgi:hypothetical protein
MLTANAVDLSNFSESLMVSDNMESIVSWYQTRIEVLRVAFSTLLETIDDAEGTFLYLIKNLLLNYFTEYPLLYNLDSSPLALSEYTEANVTALLEDRINEYTDVDDNENLFSSVFNGAVGIVNTYFFGCAKPNTGESGTQYPGVSADRYNFANEGANFQNSSISNYHLSSCDWTKLQFNSLCIDPIKGLVNNILMGIRKVNPWNGSCYGMASTAILNKQNLLPMASHFNQAQLKLVPRPITNLDVLSAINYYHLSQCIELSERTLYNKNEDLGSFQNAAMSIKTHAQAGYEQLFCYLTAGFGHAIVLKPGCSIQGNGYYLTAYDNRYPYDSTNQCDKNVTIYISNNYSTVQVIYDNTVEDVYGMLCIADMNSFNRYKIFDTISLSSFDLQTFTSNAPPEGILANEFTSEEPLTSLNNDSITIAIGIQGTTTVTNSEGQTLSFDGSTGTVTGNMILGDMHPFINGSDSTISFEVQLSDTYTFSSTAENMYAQVLGTDTLSYAKTEGVDAVTIALNEGVFVEASGEYEYSIAQTYHSGADNTKTDLSAALFKGVADKDIEVSVENGGVQANGIEPNSTVTVIDGNSTYTRTKNIASNTDAIQVTGRAGNFSIHSVD